MDEPDAWLLWRLDDTPDPAEDALTAAWLAFEPDPNAVPRRGACASVLVTEATPATDDELADLGDNDVEADDETVTVAPPERSRIPKELLPPERRKAPYIHHRKAGRRWAVAYWRRHKVVEYRLAGIAFKDIARQLGFNSVEGARYAYYRALEDTREASEDLRLLELERLDHLTKIVWPQIQLGDLEAINTYLKISAVRARVAGFERAPLVNPGNKIVIEGSTEEEERAVAMLENVGEFLALLPGLADRLAAQTSTRMIEGALLDPLEAALPGGNGSGGNGSGGGR